MRTPRRLTMLALLFTLALVVSGCGSLKGHLQVNADDTISVKAALTMKVSAEGDRAATERAMREACEAFILKTGHSKAAVNGDQVVCTIDGTLRANQIGQIGASIRHDDNDNTFLLQPASATSQERVDAFVGGKDMDLSITFPGTVLEHSGSSTQSGRTVRWTDPQDLNEGLQVRYADPGLLDRSPLEWAIIALVAAAAVTYGSWLLWDLRRHERVAHQAPWGGPTKRRRR